VNLRPTSIAGVTLVETTPHTDHRGAFARLYCEHQLAPVIGNRRIVQINHSRTSAVGAIRGLHFQRPPRAEMKLVRCLKGKIWDVAVDLRADSPTFLKWHAEELTPGNSKMLAIAEGFAHGFQVLEPYSELLYLHTAFYSPEAEGGIRYDDPALAITWPLLVTDISLRDTGHPLICSGFEGLQA
jgi:dTDP-4-dehydrorhamnose 3,5-epimerase